MKGRPLMQRMNRELAATLVPLVMAVALLGLFTVPNYMRARAWSREASVLRAVADEAASRQDNLRELRQDIERLRAALAERGRTLPVTPDQGALLASIARSADAKGVAGSQARSGKLAPVAVPGFSGGKATRRTVDVEMRGTFDALFAAASSAERLPSLVNIRSIDMTRGDGSDGAQVEAKMVFDEYFSERAIDAKSVASADGKVGG